MPALVEQTAVAEPDWQLWETSLNSNAHEEHDLVGVETPRRPLGRRGLTKEHMVEAAGIEPASAEAPNRASTSVSRLLISSGGLTPGGLPSEPALLKCRAAGEWLSLGAEPVCWRHYPSHGLARSDALTRCLG
jgi:hypothetical protein